jgi:hypothetical protein
MKACILTLLLCLSCTKYAKVSKDAMGIHIDDIDMDITHVKEIDWRVGKRKEEKISQSFIFVVDMPKVKQEELDFLLESKGIDSWIVRVIAMRGSQKQDLGSLYTLFRPRRISRGVTSTAATSASIKIFYAASFASERFRNFKCPAMNHNRRLSRVDVKGEHSLISIAVEGGSPYQEKSQLIELTPSSFNGGHSLAGDYYLEIALYDSVNKQLKSAFKRIPRYIEVAKEDQVAIESCAGIHPEIEL